MEDKKIMLGEIIEIKFRKDNREFWEKTKRIVDLFLEEDESDEELEELEELLEKVKKGEEETIPADEVIKELEGDENGQQGMDS